MKVILGPVPCQGCRRLVTWNGWEWQEAVSAIPWTAGHRHACRAKAAA